MDNLKSNERVLFICQCESEEHQLIFHTDDKYITAAVHLTHYRNFWKRLVYGVKYIFGFKSKFGSFDYILFNPDDHEKLAQLANYLKEIKDKERNER